MLTDFLRHALSAEDYYNFLETNSLNINYQGKCIESKHVYLLLSDDNTIKIGVTSNFDRRLKQVKNASGKNIINFIYTDKLEKALDIEKFLLIYFDDYRINGEWLKDVDFSRVVNKLNELLERTYLNNIQIIDSKMELLPTGDLK